MFLDVPNDGDGYNWISGDHSFSFIADKAIPGWWRHGDGTVHREVAMPDAVEYTVHLGDGKNMGFFLVTSDPDGGNLAWAGQLIFGGDDDNDVGGADFILAEERSQANVDIGQGAGV